MKTHKQLVIKQFDKFYNSNTYKLPWEPKGRSNKRGMTITHLEIMAGVEYKTHSELLEPCSLAAVKLTPLLILMSSLHGQQEQFWG